MGPVCNYRLYLLSIERYFAVETLRLVHQIPARRGARYVK